MTSPVGRARLAGRNRGRPLRRPGFIYYAPFHLLRLLSLRYAPFPRTVKGEEA